MFPAACAVLLSMRAREDFGCAEKLSAAEQIKPDCCRTPAVVSIFTDSAACVLSYHSTPLHGDYLKGDISKNIIDKLMKFGLCTCLVTLFNITY